ncbi:MAG: YajQ family cyclic di-GMP-binding protein [Chloroflexi bacterium]|nr:MAG: YajQ family cyclic di-GMP-binding protein [Chloroflexota bacterium]
MTSITDPIRTTGRSRRRWTREPRASAPCSRCLPWLAWHWPWWRWSSGCARSSASQPVPEYSFDVVSEFNPAELTNAIDQARREVGTRFDFKDTATSYDHRGDVIVIESASEDRARAALQVMREKAARRQLSPKLFQAGEPKTVGKGRGQIEVRLNAGINDDLARDLRKRIQNVSNKVQVRIQGDQLRVVSKDKDTLQAVIKLLREAEDIPVPLQFTNYR